MFRNITQKASSPMFQNASETSCFYLLIIVLLMSLSLSSSPRVEDRYSAVVTRRRALCAVLLSWMASVLSSFAQFIGSDTWRSGGLSLGTTGLGLHGNWTTSLPYVTSFQPVKYHRRLIGEYLPYGGFLSKLYVEDMHNYTYAEIHSSHWGVCAPDTLLSPQFLVYVHGVTVFLLPFLCLLTIYLDLLCTKRPRKPSDSQAKPPKHGCSQVRSLALSLSLLVLLCLPIHIIHALLLFTPSTNLPAWIHTTATMLFQLYGLVPQILFTPPRKQKGEEQPIFSCSVPQILPAFAPSKGKAVPKALCGAVQVTGWAAAKRSLKAKVWPDV